MIRELKDLLTELFPKFGYGVSAVEVVCLVALFWAMREIYREAAKDELEVDQDD